MKPLRILWTLPYLPWPITSGGKARQFHLIRDMAARGHRITLLVQSKTPADEATRRILLALCDDVIVLPRRPLKHPVTLWRVATSGLPLLTAVNAYATALSTRFEHLLRDQQWDIVQVEHSYGFEPFEQALRRHRQPFVLTEHNVESELGAATYGKWPVWMRGLAALDQRRARRWERQVLSQATAIVAVTEADAHKLHAIGGRPTHVVSNGVDTGAFAAVQPDPASNTVLFLGNYEYAPNLDAVEWALGEIAPLVWAQAPAVRFCICGHGMPTAWRQQFPDARIDWRGYVPDLSEVQRHSAVFMAPLRAGGGSKLKVLEAMAAGLPVVSTREGLSGLPVQPGRQALAADNTAEFAQALVQVLGNPDQARALGEAARQMVRATFDWATVAGQLEQVYASVLAQPAAEAA